MNPKRRMIPESFQTAGRRLGRLTLLNFGKTLATNTIAVLERRLVILHGFRDPAASHLLRLKAFRANNLAKSNFSMLTVFLQDRGTVANHSYDRRNIMMIIRNDNAASHCNLEAHRR